MIKFIIGSVMLLLAQTSAFPSPTMSKADAKSFSKFISEAEINHGRVAIPIIELVNGNQSGINELSHQDLTFQLSLIGLFKFSEFCQLFKAYKYPMDPMNLFKLKDEPGNYNFDPLNISNKIEQVNGRFASTRTMYR